MENEIGKGSAKRSDLGPRPWLKSYPHDVKPDISLDEDENLSSLFDALCERFSSRPAYTCFGHTLTYRQAHEAVCALAAFLQQKLKLEKGENLAVIMPNMLQYPITVFAGLKAGLRIVNINPLYTAREIASVLRDSNVSAVVAFDGVGARLQEIAKEGQKLPHIVLTKAGDLQNPVKGMLLNAGARLQDLVPKFELEDHIAFKKALSYGRSLPFTSPALKASDIAFLQFTGGTTGKPKGAMLSHGNLIANVRQCLEMYGHELKRGQETLLTALPLYHVFSMTVNLLLQTALGANSILITDPRRMKDLLKIIKKHPEISVMTGVNTLFAAMLDHGVFTKECPMPKLRLAIGGGAAVQSGVAERFYKASGQHILEGYGLTECSPVACVNPYTSRIFTGSIGIPVPSTYARIVDPNTHEEIWDLNVPGELEFKGPQVMQGYYQNEAENEHVRDDGWLRTGDIAVWLDGGYLKIIDRIKDMIIVSGFNVYPSEIEDVVSRYSKVAECCAVGVPSEKTGEAIKLFVVKRDPDLTVAQVLAYCREYLTGYKLPKIVEFINALPKSPVGKIMRRYLHENKYN